MAVAEMPFSGAKPAWAARPVMATSHRSAPTAPTVTSLADRPSKLNAMPIPARSAGSRWRAPNSPLSSRTVNSSVIGGCGSLEAASVAASVTSTLTPVRSSPPRAVGASDTMRLPLRTGLAPAHSGTVSM